MMVRPTYIVLHRTEWERIKRQVGPPPEDPVNSKKEYLKALTEQSQEWMKTWPDTVSGYIAHLKKKKEEEHKGNVAFIKAYAKKMKQEKTAGPIKEAKQLIFENSNYGRLLKSALLESRALEVRDTQIKFQKQLQEKAVEIEKEQDKLIKDGFLHFHENDKDRGRKEKAAALECSTFNKQIVSKNQEKEQQIKKIEKECAIQDENLFKQVRMIEQKEKDDIKRCVEWAVKKYEVENKKIEKRKALELKLDEALTEVYKKGQDRIKCKTEAVLKKVHQGRPDTKWSKEHYKKIDMLQKQENKRYEEFVDKGIENYEKRISNEEVKEKLTNNTKSSALLLISQRNKTIGEQDRIAKKCANKCHCERQSLIMKTGKINHDEGTDKTKINANEKFSPGIKTEVVEKPVKQSKSASDTDETNRPHEKLPFLAPRNLLLQGLKIRQNTPSPWNDAKGIHAQFAQQANDVLKEIKHKRFARKVVDEYRKLNCLDASTLPVPNY